MANKAAAINYREVVPPNFIKDFSEATKFELCVSIRVSDIEPKPNCNENRDDLITRLKRNGIHKAVDLGGLKDAKELRRTLNL
jgi:hypothetical protein